jgi:hypothetical protein
MKKKIVAAIAALVFSSASMGEGIEKIVCDPTGVCKINDSTHEGQSFASYLTQMPPVSDTSKPYFSDSSFTIDDEKKILDYLQESIKIDGVEKSRAERMSQDTLDVKYDITYEGLGAIRNGLKFFKFWKSSGIEVKMHAKDNKKSSFKLKSKGPYFELVKDEATTGTLTELLDEKQNVFQYTDSNYILLSSSDSTLPLDTITVKEPIDVVASISQLYTQFDRYKSFSAVERFLVVDGKMRPIRITIKNLNHHWYNFSYVDTRAARTDKVQVHEVHALIYYPGDTEISRDAEIAKTYPNIALPYKIDIITTNGSTNPVKLHAKLEM